MRRNRLYGPVSLGIMAAGSVATESLIHLAGLTGPVWQLAANGFHAGLVGSLADWYAVHVLLRPAPVFMRFWPFKTHSDLLIRNRAKLETNIMRMVQDELLSTDKIWDYLERLRLFDRGIEFCRNPRSLDHVLDFVRGNELLTPVVNQLGRPEAAAAAANLARAQLARADLAQPLGEWIVRAIDRGDQHALWEAALSGLEASLGSKDSAALIAKVVRRMALAYLPTLRQQANRPEVIQRLADWLRTWFAQLDLASLTGLAARDAIARGAHHPLIDDVLDHIHQWVVHDPSVARAVQTMLDEAVNNYKNHVGPLRRLVVAALEWAALDRGKAVAAIVGEIGAYIAQVRDDRRHPLRVSVDERIQSYAARLVEGEPRVREGFDKLRKHLMTVDFSSTLRQLVQWVGESLEASLNEPQAAPQWVDVDAIARSLAAAGQTLVAEVRSNPDHFLRTRLDAAIGRYGRKLASGDAEASLLVRKLTADLVEHSRLEGMIGSMLTGLRDTLVEQLPRADSAVWRTIHDAMAQARDHFLGSPDAQKRLADWFRDWSRALIARNHKHIGSLIERSLRGFGNDELVRIVDDKFGDDLQFVRLNGAVLGFLIGVILSLIMMGLRAGSL